MRKEVELVLYEIKHGIFPPPFDISFEEYIFIEEAVKKKKDKDFELLYNYIDKWSKFIV